MKERKGKRRKKGTKKELEKGEKGVKKEKIREGK